MRQRLVERGLADAQRLRGNRHPPGLERRARDRKPAVHLADHVGALHAHAVEHQIHAAQPAHAERVRTRLAPDALAIERQQERGDAPAARCPAASPRTRCRRRRFGVGHPDLAARQPPAVPSGVAVVSWLAASVPAFSSDSANTPTASPVASGRSHSRRCASVPKRRSTSATSELLTLRITATVALARATASMRQRVADVIVPQPAVLARDGDPEQPPRRRLPHERHRERRSTRRSRPPSAPRARVRTPRPPRGRPPVPGSVRGAWEKDTAPATRRDRVSRTRAAAARRSAPLPQAARARCRRPT